MDALALGGNDTLNFTLMNNDNVKCTTNYAQNGLCIRLSRHVDNRIS